MSATLDSTATTIEQASKQLKVSSATVRNWLRSKLLKSLSSEEIKRLNQKIKSGEVGKLRSGANKKSAHEKHHFHTELLSFVCSKSELKKINLWLITFKNEPKLVSASIFIRLSEEKDLQKYKLSTFQSLVKKFGYQVQQVVDSDVFQQLKMINVEFDDSLLTYADQFLSNVALKSKRGAFFTDPKAAAAEVDKIVYNVGDFCDPCCGTGNYLVAAFDKLSSYDPGQAHKFIFGYDIDPNAVLISQARLFLKSAGRMNVFDQIKTEDALTCDIVSRFDFICTNPPWGSEIQNTTQLKKNKIFQNLKSQESFAYFIIKIHQMLKSNGSAGLILPNSIVFVRTHREIREWILENYKIESLCMLETKFSGVMSKPISIGLRKGNFKNSNLDFKSFLNQEVRVRKILNQLDAMPYKCTLKNSANWALGVVTGDNDRFLKEKSQKGYRLPIIKGREIFKYYIQEPKSFISEQSDQFQQMAPAELYSAQEKLVYRFICNETVFAVDNRQRLTLNSANILIPKLDKIGIYAVCAILNSPAVNFYLKYKFHSIKLLRSHLEEVPIPIYETGPQLYDLIENMSRNLHQKYSSELLEKINESVFKLYRLNESEIAYIKQSLGKSSFVKAVEE